MSRGRAVVIGAGAIGIASAYFLRRSEWDVTVVDRGEVGQGCSYGNSCLIVASHSEPIPGPGVIGQALRWMLKNDSPFYIRPRLDVELVKWGLGFRRHCNAAAAKAGTRALLALSRASLELFEELTASGEAEFFYQRRGLIEVYLSEQGLEIGRRSADGRRSEGFEATLLSGDEVLEREPSLDPRVVKGGLEVDGEAHGFSYGYVRALAATFARQGGRVRTGSSVSQVIVDQGRVEGVSLDGGRDIIPADVVVLAAGAWSGDFAKPLGITLPLQPAKGYSCTIDAFEGSPKRPLLIKERKVIVTPLDKRLRFGGTLELTGFDARIDKTRYGAVVRAGSEVLAKKPPMKNEEAWCGFRPLTPDGLPVIDRVSSVDGLLVATGHAMLGFTQSPMTGKLVSQLANGEPAEIPMEPFRLDRFRA